MRNPFNTTCDIWQGPSGTHPGEFVGTFACRLVFEDAIFFVGVGSPVRVGYVTILDYAPRGAWSTTPIGLNIALADVIAIPAGSPRQFFTLQTESVLWRSQPLYYRAHVCYLLEDVPLIGEITYVAFDSLPAGWLDCDGSEVSRVTYADLFAILGTRWGAGDGMTSFNVPDLRDRCVIGKSPGSLAGSRPSVRAVGNVGGEETHLLTTTEMPSHFHQGIKTDSTSNAAGIPYAIDDIALQGQTIDAANRTTATGGDVAHNNVQPFAVMRAIIKF